MSRFAVDPRWLIYLPPTMSPSETSDRAGPAGAPGRGVRLLPQRGRRRRWSARRSTWARARSSIVCRDEEAARAALRRRSDGGSASCYTRTGRRFFDDAGARGGAARARPRRAIDAPGLWDELETDWVCLDCELMPWSAKAQELLRQQYAAVGAAARAALPPAVAALEQAAARGVDVGELLDALPRRGAATVDALRRRLPALLLAGRRRSTTCKLAPFHLLASEGAVHVDTRPRLAHGDAGARCARPTRRCCWRRRYQRRRR